MEQQKTNTFISRAAAMLLTVIMAFAGAQTAGANDALTGNQQAVNYIYYDYDDSGIKATHTDGSCTDYTQVVSSETVEQVFWGTSGSETWYVVSGDVTINNGVVLVFGNVNLILCDGAKLTVNDRIKLQNNSSLTVYAQSTGNAILSFPINCT